MAGFTITDFSVKPLPIDKGGLMVRYGQALSRVLPVKPSGQFGLSNRGQYTFQSKTAEAAERGEAINKALEEYLKSLIGESRDIIKRRELATSGELFDKDYAVALSRLANKRLEALMRMIPRLG